MALCWNFYEQIKADYLEDPVRYSPDYPRLFGSRTEENYRQVIANHTNCGGAMRSASLAYGGATPQQHLALVGMTHLFPESLAGAYALYEAVRMLHSGSTMEEMWGASMEAAWLGELQAEELFAAWKIPPAECSRMACWMQAVHRHKDPRYGITDWYAEGITTRFVVPAAMQIASEAMTREPGDALRHVVEQGIAVGGDPDTLGSMGMALIGAHFGEALQEEIDLVLERLVKPEMIEIPDFFA
jgi:ADP-ribosylglycohydrolase